MRGYSGQLSAHISRDCNGSRGCLARRLGDPLPASLWTGLCLCYSPYIHGLQAKCWKILTNAKNPRYDSNNYSITVLGNMNVTMRILVKKLG